MKFKKYFALFLILLFLFPLSGFAMNIDDGDSNDAVDLDHGGTNSALVDPGADRIIFWDDSAALGSNVTWLTPGTGLSITAGTINVTWPVAFTSDYSSDFDAAAVAIGATPTTLFVDDATTMSTNVTTPATLTTIVLKGGSIDQATNTLTTNGPLIMQGGTIDNDAVLTINGPFTCGKYQCFDNTTYGTFGDGAVTEVYPEWWKTNTTPGTTNMATPLQAALDSVGSSGTVVISNLMGVGVASWTGITVTSKNYLTLKGTNKYAGFKVLALPSQVVAGGAKVTSFLFDTCTYVSIEGLNFDGNDLDANILGLDTVSDSVIKNNFIYDTGATDANGIFTVEGTRNKYLSNSVTNCGRGMWIGNVGAAGQEGTNALIDGNHVYANQHTGIGGTLVESVISNNISHDNAGSGIAIGSVAATARYSEVVIIGNSCKGNAFHGIQSDGITDNIDYPTFITIVGNDASENDNSGIYVVGAEDWTITGNTCRNNNLDGIGSGPGIQIDTYAKRIVVSGNNCFDTRAGAARTQDIGIYVSSGVYADSVEQINITGNVCRNNLSNGIKVSQGAGFNIDSVLIGSNSTYDNGVSGIEVSDAAVDEITNVSIIGNQSLDNTTYDIRVDATVFAKIEGNFFSTHLGLDPVAFTAADATPSVKGRRLWKTDTGALTITMFDDGIARQKITVISKGAVTYDVTASDLIGGTTDIITAAGDVTTWEFDGSDWYLRSYIDQSDNLN